MEHQLKGRTKEEPTPGSKHIARVHAVFISANDALYSTMESKRTRPPNSHTRIGSPGAQASR